MMPKEEEEGVLKTSFPSASPFATFATFHAILLAILLAMLLAIPYANPHAKLQAHCLSVAAAQVHSGVCSADLNISAHSLPSEMLETAIVSPIGAVCWVKIVSDSPWHKPSMACTVMHCGSFFSPCIKMAVSAGWFLPADFLVGVVGAHSVASHLEGAEASKKKRSKYQKATMFMWSSKSL